MDLLYGRLNQRTQVMWDIFTIFFLIFYIGVMLYGAIDSTVYSFSSRRAQPDRVAAAALAGQARHLHRLLPAAAAGRCAFLPRCRNAARGDASDVLRSRSRA